MDNVEVSKSRIPVRGLLAVETRLCLEKLATLQPGETITYADLSAAAGINVRERRYVLSTATNKLLAEEQKVFVAEIGIGIRRLRNEEIPEVGTRDINRIGRMARHSRRKLAAVEYGELSPESKVRFNSGMSVLTLFHGAATRKNMERVEAAVKERTTALPLGDTLKLFGIS